MQLATESKQKRIVDTSNAEARRAVAGVVRRMAPWRLDIAQMNAIVARPMRGAERTRCLSACTEIGKGVADARIMLIESLIDAPRKVLAHSRIADVERALDGVEADLRRLRVGIEQSSP